MILVWDKRCPTRVGNVQLLRKGRVQGQVPDEYDRGVLPALGNVIVSERCRGVQCLNFRCADAGDAPRAERPISPGDVRPWSRDRPGIMLKVSTSNTREG
jgi:hypothetical protein